MWRSNSGSTGGCQSHAVTVRSTTNHHLKACAAPTDVSAMCTMGYRQLNLIPLNAVPGSRFTRSREEDMDEFRRRLERRGISTTMRDTRGSDIDAACGQLAAVGGGA